MRNPASSALILAACLASAPAMAGDGGWKFAVGPSFVSGLGEVQDFYTLALEREGYVVNSSFQIPIGVVFTPYYETRSGVMFCIDVGPIIMVSISGGGDKTLFDIPLGASCGFDFNPHGEVSPYMRGGFRVHMASGSYVEGSDPGLFAAAGLTFARNRRINFGLELGVDTSTLNLSSTRLPTKSIKPMAFTASFRVIF